MNITICMTLLMYCDIIDVLLISIKNLRNNIYKGLWMSSLKKTEIGLELLTNIDISHVFGNWIWGVKKGQLRVVLH